VEERICAHASAVASLARRSCDLGILMAYLLPLLRIHLDARWTGRRSSGMVPVPSLPSARTLFVLRGRVSMGVVGGQRWIKREYHHGCPKAN